MSEESILHSNLVLDLEHELLALLIELEHLLRLDLRITLLESLSVSYSNRVILRTDLHNHLHLTLVVEHLEGINGRCISAIYILESHLKVTNVLKTLDSDILTVVTILVELYWFHHALYDSVSHSHDNHREYEIGQDLFKN